jgi:hypothetical protein
MSYTAIPTLIAQAIVGGFAGNFLLIIIRLLYPHPYNVVLVATVPFLLIFAVATGIPAGLAIWVCGWVADRPLNGMYRGVIGVAVLALFWLGYALLVSWIPSSSEELTFLLVAVLTPGIGIGLVTNSGLRLRHELVRKGEAYGRLPRCFAGISGLLLRTLVVLLFMISLIAMWAIFQSDYYQREDRIWSLLFFCHFAGGFALLFWRMKTSVLVPLALLVNVPMVIAVFEYRYFAHDLRPVPIVYLAVWAIFLVSRWRQTDFALSFLNEEIRYYLID